MLRTNAMRLNEGLCPFNTKKSSRTPTEMALVTFVGAVGTKPFRITAAAMLTSSLRETDIFRRPSASISLIRCIGRRLCSPSMSTTDTSFRMLASSSLEGGPSLSHRRNASTRPSYSIFHASFDRSLRSVRSRSSIHLKEISIFAGSRMNEERSPLSRPFLRSLGNVHPRTVISPTIPEIDIRERSAVSS